MKKDIDNEYLDFDFGQALKAIRKERGFKRREVFLGICSENTYGNIENNITKNYDFRFMVSFCSRMGVSVDYLISRAACHKLKNYQKKLMDMNLFLRISEASEAEQLLNYFEDNQIIDLLPTIDKQYVLYARAAVYAAKKEWSKAELRVRLEEALVLTLDVNNKYQMSHRKAYSRGEMLIVGLLLSVTGGTDSYVAVARAMVGFLDGHLSEVYQPLIAVLQYALVCAYYERQELDKMLEMCDAGIRSAKRMKIHFYLSHFLMYKAFVLAKYRRSRQEITECVDQSLVLAKAISHDCQYRQVLDFMHRNELLELSDYK